MLQICVTKKKINEFEFENIILDKVFLHCVPYRVCQQSCSFSLRICFAFVSCSCCWRWRCCCLCRCRLPTDLLLDFSLVQKIFSRCAVVWSGKLKFAFKLLKGFTVYCFHSFVRSHVRPFVRPFVRLCSVRSSAGALLISIVREAAAEQQQQHRPKEETAGSSVWFYSTAKSVQ